MREEIIQLLKAKKNYLSGEEISEHFRISRAAIWKHVEELRKDGYEIEGSPRQGYRLKNSPDKMFPGEIKEGLKTRVFGRKIFYYDSLETTMATCFELGLAGEAEGAVVCAETQTKGKGRLGRKWNSPKGKGIYFSILLRPLLPVAEVAKLTLLAAVSVCEAINKVTGLNSAIKWPNDILLGGKKVAGILTELNAETDRVNFIVIGVGINVNTSKTLLPNEAASLKIEAGKEFSRIVLLQEILCVLERWYLEISQSGFAHLMKRWKELSATLGMEVRVFDGKETIEGVATDLDEFGRLVIKNGSGKIIKKISGDVTII